MTHLIVSPLSQVAALLEARKPSHVLTLLSPDSEIPVWEDVQQKTLRFHDISTAAQGLTAPDENVVREILAFGRAWSTVRTAPMLVHCYAGISRSTAAAYILACSMSPEAPEDAIARNLRAQSATATPNSLMVGLADSILRRKGRMVAAVQAMDRGDFASEGVPFDLLLEA